METSPTKAVTAADLVREVKQLLSDHIFTLSRDAWKQKDFREAQKRVEEFSGEGAVPVLDAIYYALGDCDFSREVWPVFADWGARAWPLVPDVFWEYNRFSDAGEWVRPVKWFSDEVRITKVRENEFQAKEARKRLAVADTAQRIASRIAMARMRQYDETGLRKFEDGAGNDLLAEAVAEVNAATDVEATRERLMKVAALAAEWVEAIDRDRREG